MNYGGNAGIPGIGDNCIVFGAPYCDHGNFEDEDPLLCGDEVTDCWIRPESPCRDGNHPNGCSCGTIGARSKPGNETDLIACGYPASSVERIAPDHNKESIAFGNLLGVGKIQIRFQNPPSFVEWSLIDVAGRRVAKGKLPGHERKQVLDLRSSARGIGSGIYFLQVKVGDTKQTARVVVIK